MATWYRTINVVKEVSRGQVILKIPFFIIPVKELKVESWYYCSDGNEMIITLHREEPECPIQKILDEKRQNYDKFLAYPGERLR
jgi:hypothetical protein